MQKKAIIIAPSILAADQLNLQRDCESLIRAGADWLHVDIMDGQFVPNITFGPDTVKQLRKAFPSVFLDCHLMVQHPSQWVDKYITAGASQIQIHLESTYQGNCDISCLLSQIKGKGIRTGIVINPTTDEQSSSVLDTCIQQSLVDNILVMTVQPGFGGQSFMKEQLEKVKRLRVKYPQIDIQVDGGVKVENYQLALEAGANVIVSGTGILAQSDYSLVIQQMRQVQ